MPQSRRALLTAASIDGVVVCGAYYTAYGEWGNLAVDVSCFDNPILSIKVEITEIRLFDLEVRVC